MKYRLLKKKNDYARCQYIADKLGCIERGILVEYFKKRPTDLKKVIKRIYSKRYRSILKKDIRSNYHNPKFNQRYCNWVVFQLESGYFLQYVKLSFFDRINYNLTDLPLFESNPFGVETWGDNSLHSIYSKEL